MTDPIVSPHFLYVLHVPSGAIKIGITQNVDKRVRAIQTANHEKITVALRIKMPSYEIASAFELLLHRRYNNKRIHLEWFSVDPQEVRQDIIFAIQFMKIMAPHLKLSRAIIPDLHEETQPVKTVITDAVDEPGADEPEPEMSIDDQDLYEEAVALIRRQNRASINLLQMRFSIGYTRAARIMDRIEQSGVLKEFGLVRKTSGHYVPKTA